MNTICRLALFAALLCPVPGRVLAASERLSFYVGTFTRAGGSQGIYHCELDLGSGAIGGGELAAVSVNPGFLAVHPGGGFLYSANGGNPGSVTAFAIGKDDSLKRLDAQSSRGAGPAHVSVDAQGKHLFVANYGSGSIAVFPILPDGEVGPASDCQQHHGSSVAPRQKEPHPHAIYADAEGRFVYVPDLGLDRVMIYRLDQALGTLSPGDPQFAALAPGSGPRHLAFDAGEKFVYVVNELGNTLTVFQHDAATGALREVQTLSTLAADFKGDDTAAQVVVHPGGRFVYSSNRGENSIATFAVGEGGKLKLLSETPCGGVQPRDFAIDPSGAYLLAANQASDSVVVFRIDRETGGLTQLGAGFHVFSPVCIAFVPESAHAK